ncbi:MAG: DASS family sodium-coupled anion symporter, partial [Pseudomonadales bacterium]|nr:DASS family sodium-coupled anion symporter [Pseudomonadales bacterium]
MAQTEVDNTSSVSKPRIAIALIGLFIAFSILLLKPFPGDVNQGIFIFIVAASLWITEAIHLTATALLVPLLAVALGVFTVNDSLDKFSHPIIFIFLGGFTLAAALRKTQLDKVIASYILKVAQGRARIAIWLLFVATAVLSMWVSNTAVTAMMLPLAFGLIASLSKHDIKTTYFILLGTAYSASIGGMATLVGSPPNAIAGAALNLTFVDWFSIGGPLVVIMLPILLTVLYWVIRPNLSASQTVKIASSKATNGSGIVILIFLATVGLWLLGKPIGTVLGIAKYFDAWVAISAIVALLVTRSLLWKDIEKGADWGVLLLFGGGMALGAVLKQTGASAFIATGMQGLLDGIPFFMFLVALVTFVIFITELTSNTATAALLVPLFITIAEQMGFEVSYIVMGIGFAASCAFMLPVA